MVEGGITLEGEEEVTTDEVKSMSGLLEEYSRLFHMLTILVTARRVELDI